MLPLNTRSKVAILPWGLKGDKQSREKGEVRREKGEARNQKTNPLAILPTSHFSLLPMSWTETSVGGGMIDGGRQIDARERAV